MFRRRLKRGTWVRRKRGNLSTLVTANLTNVYFFLLPSAPSENRSKPTFCSNTARPRSDLLLVRYTKLISIGQTSLLSNSSPSTQQQSQPKRRQTTRDDRLDNSTVQHGHQHRQREPTELPGFHACRVPRRGVSWRDHLCLWRVSARNPAKSDSTESYSRLTRPRWQTQE